MDKGTQEDASRRSESELTSLSPKRPRTDWAVTEDLSGKSTSDSSEPRTLQKSCLSSSNPQNPGSLAFAAECGHYQHKKPRDKPQDDTLSDTHLTALHSSGVDKESDVACFVRAEQDEKTSVTETDKLSPYLRVDTDGAPPPTNNNTSSLPNCAQLGKSCEDETPGSFSLSTGNDKDGTQSDVSQLQAVPSCSNQPDCSSKDAEQHTGLCYTGSQLAEVMVTNQERLEADFSNHVPLSKAEDKSPISSRDLADPNPLCSHPEEVLSRTLAEDGKNEKQKPELQSCENENLFVCDGKTEVNDSSKTLFCSAAACAEGSNLPNAGVLDANIAAEDGSFEVDNYIGADRSAETSKISQEPAEGDNDCDAFSVIDPAICSEIDAEVKGTLCNSDSTAGRESSPIVKICNTETALPLCSNVGTSQVEGFHHRGSTQPSKDENQIQCQSATSKETQDEADGKASCQSSNSSSPAKAPPAEVGGVQESPDTVGRNSSRFAVSPDHVETQEVEYSQSETDRGVEAAGIKEGEEPAQSLKGKQIDEQESPAKPTNTGETSEHAPIRDSKLKRTDGEQGNKPERFSDKPESFVMSVTNGEKQGEGIHVGKEIKPSECEDSEIWEISEDIKRYPTSMSSDEQQDSNVKEESPDESISEWVKGSRFTVCSDDSEQRLGCFSHYQLSSDIFLTIPSANDAVVPCQPNLEHSADPQSGSTALKSSDRFPPSALALSNHVLGGFDIFEKIKLSPDYDDDDVAGLSNVPLLTTLTGEMLETPQQQVQHHRAKTELDIHKSAEDKEEGETEEEVEGTGCHVGNVANGFVSCDSAHTDALDSISAADVIELAWPEQQPICGSASDSSEGTHNGSGSSAAPPESGSPPSDLNHNFQFEMKEDFDRVLKELSLFFDISRNDFEGDCGPKSPDVPEPPESHSAKITSERLSSPELGYQETSTDKADEDHSLEMCEVNPVVCSPALSRDSEQEVPLNKNLCQDPSRVTAGKHKEPQNVEQKVKMWSPSAMRLPPLEHLRHRLPEQPRRLEPLKTCTRPIRVGLSKRAKTKHLHRSHPYK
ncbi:microtubule-associated protein futsch-like [Kryptolebias marmoratus]|uniref:microtubule-associated protein futsch-like n=1 Tax=Kryptolebias marmoratus TaxID=37003 RepID=UPI000D5302C7|nr:microtubule-associated protein futsch-like [Kryptolebias marmoratus]